MEVLTINQVLFHNEHLIICKVMTWFYYHLKKILDTIQYLFVIKLSCKALL